MKLNNNDLQAFDDLPHGWTVTTLGAILPLTYGKALKKETRDESGKVPVYGSSGQVGVHSDALTKKPALIVGRKGSVGQVYRSPVSCWPIDTVYFVEEREDSDLRFFEHLLKGLNLSRLDKSTAVPGLSRDDYNAVEVAVAPLDQQKRIVAEIEKQFSRLDEAVANLKRVKANLKRYKAAVLKVAVEGRLVETEAELARRAAQGSANVAGGRMPGATEGRSYETGEQLLQRILETRRSQWKGKGKYKEPAVPDTTDLPELPEGWVWATAVQVCDPVVDCHNKTAPYTDSGIPLVRTTNIRDGRLLLEEARYVDQPTYDFWSRRCPPEPGDVLFTREAPMGEAAIISPGTKLCMGQRMMLMRPSDAISAEFLLYALMSPVIRRLIERTAVGTGVKHLRVGDVELLPIPIPPGLEQSRIVAEVDRRLSLAREVEAQVDANYSRGERLRQSLLKAAFSGYCAFMEIGNSRDNRKKRIVGISV